MSVEINLNVNLPKCVCFLNPSLSSFISLIDFDLGTVPKVESARHSSSSSTTNSVKAVFSPKKTKFPKHAVLPEDEENDKVR